MKIALACLLLVILIILFIPHVKHSCLDKCSKHLHGYYGMDGVQKDDSSFDKCFRKECQK